ncbi:Similar to Opioid growth factor receptor; acc. no. Q9QXY4 [Pyronema omphalodes CBS 100304]|uniref:Similar to Opioid growth factor receptor acc. no. Q9QXY4 n=1 Tax=Pyronema omphalodes (strain CBS 100304) TaxID=1076935 RepID=U4LSD5_PYROM|nr:Similar to Opioid growth factor receptor; acc. no. Q9QXY4 [Pyronema omphalodes CBS 100304]
MDDDNSATDTSWLYKLPPITLPAEGETISHPNPHKLVAFYLNQGCDHRNRCLSDIRDYGDRQLEGIHDYIQWLFPLPEGSDFNPQAPLITMEVAAAFRKDPKLRDELRESFKMMVKTWGFFWDFVYANEIDDIKERDYIAEYAKEHKEEDTKEKLRTLMEKDKEAYARKSKAGGSKAGAMESTPSSKKRKLVDLPFPPPSPPDQPRRFNAPLQMGRLTRITGPQAFLKKSRHWYAPRSHNHLRITRIIRCLRVLGLPREAEEFYQALVKASEEVEARGPNKDSLMYWRRAAKRPLWIQPREDLKEEQEVEEEEETWWQMGMGEDEEEEEEEEEEEAEDPDHEEDTDIMEISGSKGDEDSPIEDWDNGKESMKVMEILDSKGEEDTPMDDPGASTVNPPSPEPERNDWLFSEWLDNRELSPFDTEGPREHHEIRRARYNKEYKQWLKDINNAGFEVWYKTRALTPDEDLPRIIDGIYEERWDRIKRLRAEFKESTKKEEEKDVGNAGSENQESAQKKQDDKDGQVKDMSTKSTESSTITTSNTTKTTKRTRPTSASMIDSLYSK